MAGLLSDRIGRVRTLQITILWFAFFTCVCGFAQSFGQLLAVAACRAGLRRRMGRRRCADGRGDPRRAPRQGGGRRAERLGDRLGCGGDPLGGLFSCSPQETAWRALFVAGSCPRCSCCSSAFRRRAGRFRTRRPRRREAVGLRHLRAGADRDPTGGAARHRRAGRLLRDHDLAADLSEDRAPLSVLNTSGYLVVIIAGSFVGYLVGAHLADRIGRRNNFLLFAVCSFVIVLAYTQLAIDDRTMLILGFPLGFFASGIFSGMGAFLTELFPTRVRGSAQGFAYNFGRGIGALFPALVGWLGATMPLGQAIGLFAAVAYAVLFLAALLLPETRGRELAAN